MLYLLLGFFGLIGIMFAVVTNPPIALMPAAITVLASALVGIFVFTLPIILAGSLFGFVLILTKRFWYSSESTSDEFLDDSSEAESTYQHDFEDAVETVRAFEAERKENGFKPGWLYFKCKDDDLLLEALKYLRSTGEIPEPIDKNAKEQKHNADNFQTEHFDPYEILGIQSSASSQEIKSSYKNQMKLYHPDRVAHLGEALQELANKKTQDIQRAFETLMSNA